MLNFCSLYSGSSGNSLLIQTENTNILVDIGVSSKKIVNALDSLDINPNTIFAILITHEHIDHVQGLRVFSKKYNTKIYINKETFNALKPSLKEGIISDNINFIQIGDVININDLKVESFSIPHDAANPCGFNIYKNNKKISIATDIGCMNMEVLKKLENSCFLLLESNYDPEILKCSSYPFELKRRISGNKGHLSNEIAGKTISHLISSGLETAVIGHLSKESNFPELAYTTVMNELIENNLDSNFNLSVASRDTCGKIINIT